MVDFKPLDPEFPIEQQLGVKTGPVVLVNVFTVDEADQEALIEAWRNDALWMKSSRATSTPSFIRPLAVAACT